MLITIGPMVASLYLSFTTTALIQAPEWTGPDNYARMLDDPCLHKSLSVTFIYVIVGVPLQLIVALAIAMLLNERMKGWPSTGRSSTCRQCRRLGCHCYALAADV